jgi:hypothetical protein
VSFLTPLQVEVFEGKIVGDVEIIDKSNPCVK